MRPVLPRFEGADFPSVIYHRTESVAVFLRHPADQGRRLGSRHRLQLFSGAENHARRQIKQHVDFAVLFLGINFGIGAFFARGHPPVDVAYVVAEGIFADLLHLNAAPFESGPALARHVGGLQFAFLVQPSQILPLLHQLLQRCGQPAGRFSAAAEQTGRQFGKSLHFALLRKKLTATEPN